MAGRLGRRWSLDHRAESKVQMDQRVMILRENFVVMLPACLGARSRMEPDRDSTCHLFTQLTLSRWSDSDFGDTHPSSSRFGLEGLRDR